MKTLRPVLALCLGCSLTAQAAESPAILKIRDNYELVNAQIINRYYEMQQGETGCGPIVYTRWLDDHSVVRRLEWKGYPLGSREDLPDLVTSLWFDEAGRLDFALYQDTEHQYKMNAQNYLVMGKNDRPIVEKTIPRVEMRVYFDDKGKVIRLLNKYPISQKNVNSIIGDIREKLATPWKELILPGGCAH